MILSSCGCKVSWALRGGCGSCGSLPGLCVLSTQQVRCVRHPCSCKQSCRPRFGKIHRILPNHPSPNLRIFRWGRWCDTRVQLCAGNAINANNSDFHAAGFTIIFTSAGLPTDWRSGSSSRMYPCPSSSSSVGKISSVFLKNFPRHI